MYGYSLMESLVQITYFISFFAMLCSRVINGNYKLEMS